MNYIFSNVTEIVIIVNVFINYPNNNELRIRRSALMLMSLLSLAKCNNHFDELRWLKSWWPNLVVVIAIPKRINMHRIELTLSTHIMQQRSSACGNFRLFRGNQSVQWWSIRQYDWNRNKSSKHFTRIKYPVIALQSYVDASYLILWHVSLHLFWLN